MRRGGPEPASHAKPRKRSSLPLTTVAAAVVAAGLHGAGAAHSAIGSMRRDERVTGLRVRGDLVRVERLVAHVDLAGGGADVKARVGARATDVGVLTGVEGLHLGDHVAGIGLRGRVLALGALAEEGRQSDRGEDAD